MYNPQLLKFQTTDNLKLPGLLYQPKHKADKVIIWLHGNGSSSIFYSADRMNTIAQHLNQEGIAFFPFNNRGAHYIKTLNKMNDEEDERVTCGMTYELIKDCVHDIDGSINFLKDQGFKTFYLIGHSTGANKIAVYNFYKPKNEVEKYILLAGGDDTGIYFNELGEKRFKTALKLCKTALEKGRGMKMVPKYLSPYFPMSYQSFYDTINPDGDYNVFPFFEAMKNTKLSSKELFREYKSINKKTLVLYGEFDEFCYGDVPKCMEILKQEAVHKNKFTFQILSESDHSFSEKDKELAQAITSWLIK